MPYPQNKVSAPVSHLTFTQSRSEARSTVKQSHPKLSPTYKKTGRFALYLLGILRRKKRFAFSLHSSVESRLGPGAHVYDRWRMKFSHLSVSTYIFPPPRQIIFLSGVSGKDFNFMPLSNIRFSAFFASFSSFSLFSAIVFCSFWAYFSISAIVLFMFLSSAIVEMKLFSSSVSLFFLIWEIILWSFPVCIPSLRRR